MKVVYSHFPIQLKLQGNRPEISNFLGEKKARYADITEGVIAKVANDEVVLTGSTAKRLGILRQTSSTQPISVTGTPGSSRTAYTWYRGAEASNDN